MPVAQGSVNKFPLALPQTASGAQVINKIHSVTTIGTRSGNTQLARQSYQFSPWFTVQKMLRAFTFGDRYQPGQ